INRPVTPYGILANCTTLKDVVISSSSPIWAFIGTHIAPGEIADGGEGRSYIGHTSIITLLVVLGIIVRNRFATRGDSPAMPLHRIDPVWLFVAFAAFVFSSGVPFVWHMEWLLDYVSTLKQFRTLGRFNWIFYYVITIYSSVVIYHGYARYIAANKNAMAYTILLGGMGLWAFEASGYVARTHRAVDAGYDNYNTLTSANEQTWLQFLQEHKYKKEDFQALLVLPFFETGSEKLWVCSDENASAWGIAVGIKASLQLHLPMVDGMMSRTSWPIAFSQVKIAGGPYTYKPMLDTLPNEKPFLLLRLDDQVLNPDQQYLLQASDSIGHFTHCYAYACYPARLKASDRHHQSIKLPLTTTNDTCIKYAGPWYAKHFDEPDPQKFSFPGYGGKQYSTSQNPVIAAVTVQPRGTQLYEFSCWFRVSTDDYNSPICDLELLDSAGNTLQKIQSFTKESTDNRGGYWLRNSIYFTIPVNTRKIVCSIEDIPGHTWEAINDLLLRPAEAVIITSKAGDSFLINNH
ncbi:MAG: hypothetical protein H7257_00750, partial [Taibaiella sp.]|nr:hypothetical protein [Taibaiella sp.]